VRATHTATSSLCNARWRQQLGCCVLLLIACAAAPDGVRAQAAAASPASDNAPLAIQVNDDRMTLAVAKAPQVYFYGFIDAEAPRRVDALMKAGKIPPGSDVYLNSPGGDLEAGLALGRLIRSGSMVTHVGSPRRVGHQPTTPKSALCVNACAYAYFGGLYRWAPAGSDRLGLQPLDTRDPKARVAESNGPTVGDMAAYLKDMGIDPRRFAPSATAPHADVQWLDADQMIATGLANNGRLPPTATLHVTSGAPSLTLSQMARDGEHRITLLCKPDGVMLTAYYTIGDERAKRVVARAARSYFEVDQQQTLQESREGVSVTNQSVVITRPVPLAQLNYLLSGRSMGAWLADRGGAVRYGFTIFLDSVRSNLNDYSANCAQMAKAPAEQKAR
jgi:hypothetical protein